MDEVYGGINVVYFVRRNTDGLIKIGTTGGLWLRFCKLRSREGSVQLLGIIHGSYDEEKAIHRACSKYRVRGEWFSPSAELIAFIKSNTHMPKKPKKAKRNDYYLGWR